MSETPPFMKLWHSELIADTAHLSANEFGAYMLLLMAMWRNGGTLPNDDKLLARYARLTRGQWTKMKATILAFMKCNENEITQVRLMTELISARQLSQSQSNKAKAKTLKNNETARAAANDRQNPLEPEPKLESKSLAKPVREDTSLGEIPGLNGSTNDLIDKVCEVVGPYANRPFVHAKLKGIARDYSAHQIRVGINDLMSRRAEGTLRGTPLNCLEGFIRQAAASLQDTPQASLADRVRQRRESVSV